MCKFGPAHQYVQPTYQWHVEDQYKIQWWTWCDDAFDLSPGFLRTFGYNSMLREGDFGI